MWIFHCYVSLPEGRFFRFGWWIASTHGARIGRARSLTTRRISLQTRPAWVPHRENHEWRVGYFFEWAVIKVWGLVILYRGSITNLHYQVIYGDYANHEDPYEPIITNQFSIINVKRVWKVLLKWQAYGNIKIWSLSELIWTFRTHYDSGFKQMQESWVVVSLSLSHRSDALDVVSCNGCRTISR